MPYQVDPMLTEIGAKKNSVSEVKKSHSSSKQAEGETISASNNEATPPRNLKKTGIPRVKPKPVERRSATDDKRSDDKKSEEKRSDDKKPEDKRVSEEKRLSCEDKHSTDEKGKRSGSVILEKAPNKKAQRAKGSTTLGKIPAPISKSRPTSSMDQISRPDSKEEDSRDEGRTSSGKPLKKISKGKLKVLGKDSKEDDKIQTRTKSNWVTEKGEERRKLSKDAETQKTSRMMPDVAIETDKDKDQEILQNSIPPIPPSTCSFFEKIQQGVRAYFTSKGTMRDVTTLEDTEPEKPNITEGGINLG